MSTPEAQPHLTHSQAQFSGPAERYELFRQRLQQELAERIKNNPRYSLRAFAKALNASPSSLSAMLNRKRPITEKSVHKLGPAIGLTPQEINQYLHPHRFQTDESQFYQVLNDQFSYISDWYHYGVLELIKVKNFVGSASWISKALRISLNEAKTAIERLQRLNLIKISENGKWLDLSGGFSSSLKPGFTSSAAREHQKQILRKSIASIDEVEIEKRDHTAVTMAIETHDLDKAREIIRRFREEMCHNLEKNKTPDEVYQLTISFFPISQTQSNNKESQS